MHIWGKGRAAGRVGSGQTFYRQSRVWSGPSQSFARSGPGKVTRGHLWVGYNYYTPDHDAINLDNYLAP